MRLLAAPSLPCQAWSFSLLLQENLSCLAKSCPPLAEYKAFKKGKLLYDGCAYRTAVFFSLVGDFHQGGLLRYGQALIPLLRGIIRLQ